MAASRDGLHRVRGLYGLAAAFALSVLSFSVSAQGLVTLVSNAETPVTAPSYDARAQGFTTGSNPNGYDLESVVLSLGLVPASIPSVELVTLHADDAGMPGDIVARFANPEPLTVGSNRFWAPFGTWLEPDSTYYLVVNLEADAGTVFGLGASAGPGRLANSDWAIDDLSWRYRDVGGWGIDVASVLRFSLTGTPHSLALATSVQAGPAAQTVSVTDTSATVEAPVDYVEPAAAAGEAANAGTGLTLEVHSGGGPSLLLVANTGQPPAALSHSIVGQGFTTGRDTRGYTLGGVDLYMENATADALSRTLVTLHADADGEPGQQLARFTNPDTVTPGANRFQAPEGAVLDPNTAYFLAVNMVADAPQGFALVATGKTDVPMGDPEWLAHTGSWSLTDNWLWRSNADHALRFALFKPGEDDPPPPTSAPEVVAAVPEAEAPSAPVETTEIEAVTPEPPDTLEAVVAETPPPDTPIVSDDTPHAPSTPAETVATTPPPPPASDASEDDDDDDPPPAWTRNSGTWIAAAAGVAAIALSGSSDDGAAPRNEPVAVTPPPPPLSGDASLISLTVTELDGTTITLSPVFSSETGSYTASVPNAVAAVSILPRTNDENAQIQFMDANDAELPDADTGISEFQANLGVGANTFKVKVTAENDVDAETYSLTLDRAAPLSSDATLISLEVTRLDGTRITLSPVFSSAMNSYSASVPNAVAAVTILPGTSDASAQIQFMDANDADLPDADSGMAEFQANLAVGANTYKVKVTAENGMDLETYSVTLDRGLAQVAGVGVEPYIEALEVSWEAVEYADKYMVQWKWGEQDFESGGDRERVTNGGSTSSMISNLQAGMEYTMRVIAFRSNVGQGPPSDEVMGIPLSVPLSSDATLSNLRVTRTSGAAISLTPTFSSSVTGYSASVPHDVSRVTILPTSSDANAQIEFLDSGNTELDDADTGMSNFQADLAVGANTFNVRITAQNGIDTATYSVTLTRAIAPADQVPTIRVLPGPEALIVLWDAAANADGYKLQWKSGNQDYASGGNREAVISDGSTEIHTILNLIAGVEYTLRLIATRNGAVDSAPSKEAKGTPYSPNSRSDVNTPNTDDGDNTNNGGGLTDLEVTDSDDTEVTLSPTFSTSRRSYTASVVNTVTWVTFKPTLRNATVAYEDGSNQSLTDANGNEDDFQVNLAEGSNTVKLRVTASGETAAETYTVTITRAPANVVQNNNAPAFSTSTATREFAEDLGDGTRTGVNVGVPVTADDDDNDSLTYTLEGADESQFAIVSTTGQIRSRSGVNYDRESDASYSVTVKTDDSNGGTDTIAVTINLTDVEEKPLAPDAPSVSAVSGSTTSVSVTWTAPTNTGRPSITSYDLQYKKTADSSWTDGPQNVSGTNTTISSLDEDTNYDVQVRATNADGDGPYSGTGSGKTARPGNRAPDFGASSATREFEENFAAETSTGVDVGAPVTATDQDNDTLEYSLEGTDAASFEIDSSSGQISTVSGTNYDRESDSSYSVTVKADDGEGGTDTISVTINLTDVEEKPLAPDAPSVSSVENSTNSLSVTWTAPTNTGRPSFTSYDLQYKKSTETDQDWQDGPQNRSGTTATITGLDGNISYDVQVRASNSDGDGPWSGTGSGTTNPDPPQIGSAAIRAFDEDVGDGTRSGVDVGSPVTASDHGANHTYTLGGTDSGSFTITSTTGQIRSRSGVNFDYEAQSSYSVSVESDNGNGGTETIQVTINLNDVTEKPKKPAAPDVESIAGNTRVIYVTWTAPSNTGRPPITSYDLQYREAPSGPWFNGPQDQTGMMASISNLSPSTEYDVQVRATNADGDGPWSDDGSATTAEALPETCAMSENGDVRLADGFTPKEGRVEICAEDPDTSGQYIWGTVCDDYWTDEEAGVVCKALDYHNSEPIGGRFLESNFGSGTLDFLLDDLLCRGNESGLLDCPVAGGGLASANIGEHNCRATETVGVRCLTEAEYTQHVTEVEDDNSDSPMLSVGDVTVYETPGTTMDFVVTLSGTPTGTVTVNYVTQDGNAIAHIDYVPKSGMVTFPLGTTSRTVSITVLDDLVDEHDEQGERMTLRLSNATGGAHILDGVAYGTIENSDPLPQAWLARFSRAAADQAVEAISGRLTASGPRTSQVTVAGRRLDVSGNTTPTQAGAPGIHGISGSSVPSVIGSGLPGGVGPSRGYASGGYRSSGVSGRQLLTGTSFQWALGVDDETGESAAGNSAGFAGAERRATWTAWGEGAATRFSGAEDTLSLQGDVATATLGIDREGERWMAGVALAFSEGAGAFTALGDDIAGTNTGTAGGLLQTTLTTVYPYARYRLNDRLSIWGALGYGQGDLRLTEGRAGTVFDTDTGLRVGALGARGVILDANGYELALRSDAMRVQMTSDTVVGLAGAVANTGRVRALLEGSRMFALGENRAIEPTLEFGLRHDSGDAETGSGVELGAGIRYTDAVLGLSLEANARGLVAHQDSAYEEWGAWAMLRLDPGEPGKGLSLSLSPTWGAANSGLDQLWNSASVPGYGVAAPGYGIGASGFGAGTPGYGTGSPGYAAGTAGYTAASPGFAPGSQGYAPGSPGYAANSWLNPGARLSAELGYGVDAFRGMGMGTYYSGLERAGSGFQSWRLGKRWELGTQLQMSVEGERNEFELMDPDHAISIQGLLLW